jgi:hypothetical protein
MSYDEDKDRDTGPAAQRSGAVPTAKRPIAAKTPTAPPEPARVIAQESRQPRYATVTRSPKKASVRPIPSNVTVVAESTPVGSRVQDERAKTKKRSHHPKPGIGHHPERDDHDLVATAAGAGGAGAARRLSVFTSILKPWVASKSYVTPWFLGETSLDASVPGVEIHESEGHLTLTWGSNTLVSLSLNKVVAEAVGAAISVVDKYQDLKKGLTITTPVAGGLEATVTIPPGRVLVASVAFPVDGVPTTVTIDPVEDKVTIVSTVAERLAKHVPLSRVAVDLTATTTLRFLKGRAQKRPVNPNAPTAGPLTPAFNYEGGASPGEDSGDSFSLGDFLSTLEKSVEAG